MSDKKFDSGERICGCGYIGEKDERFCPDCGGQLEIIKQISKQQGLEKFCKCGFTGEENESFCPYCGEQLEINKWTPKPIYLEKLCKCGYTGEENELFCPECGEQLGGNKKDTKPHDYIKKDFDDTKSTDFFAFAKTDRGDIDYILMVAMASAIIALLLNLYMMLTISPYANFRGMLAFHQFLMAVSMVLMGVYLHDLYNGERTKLLGLSIVALASSRVILSFVSIYDFLTLGTHGGGIIITLISLVPELVVTGCFIILTLQYHKKMEKKFDDKNLLIIAIIIPVVLFLFSVFRSGIMNWNISIFLRIFLINIVFVILPVIPFLLLAIMKPKAYGDKIQQVSPAIVQAAYTAQPIQQRKQVENMQPERNEKQKQYRPLVLESVANFIWFILIGWALGFILLLYGLVICITIVGIPLGLGILQMAKLYALPFGKIVIRETTLKGRENISTGMQVWNLIINILWFPLGLVSSILGILSGILCLIIGIIFTVTIVGIPLGILYFTCSMIHFKSIPFFIAPAGIKVVTRNDV